MSEDNVNDLLMGIPAFKFDAIGSSVTGVISDLSVEDATDFYTKEIKLGKNGKPVRVIVITLDLPDDSKTKVYVKPAAKFAINQAVRDAGSNGIDLGGTLTLTHSGEEPSGKPGLAPKKLFTAQYVAPTETSGEPVEELI